MISQRTYKNKNVPWWDIRGLSTDTKPTEGVPNGATFIEMDTSKGYLFDAENSEWCEIESGSPIVIPVATGVEF